MSSRKRFNGIKAAMTRKDNWITSIFSHPHRKKNARFPHVVRIKRTLGLNAMTRLNQETTAPYSVDSRRDEDLWDGYRYEVSFQDPQDAMLFKLWWVD